MSNTDPAHLSSVLGKLLLLEKIFEGDEFTALDKAVAFCKGKGFSVGSMQREAPIGIARGDCYISKWRNMTLEDKKGLDGVIVGESKRKGPVTVLWAIE